nr:reverse transcriptase domain-containing protein [Tanacetum cinerariifolium]
MPCECLAIIESNSKVRYSRNKPVVAKVSMNTSTFGISPDVAKLKDMVKALLLDKKSQNYASTSSSGTLPSNTIGNPRSDLKAITTRSGVSYDGPQIPHPPSFLPKSKSRISTSEPVTSLTIEPVISPVSAPMPNPKSLVPYPSRRNDERNREKANNQIENSTRSSKAELKDLPPYLEYAFLKGDNKLPVIIAKDLSMEEKTALITVLKSHKRAIAWKLSDIKEVIKLLDAGLIYPISDSPWVSPVHCVPKKGGFTVVENEDSELIPTRLVMGWRVCIDYRKLNEVTHKDHFPLPFMDQILERLARNQCYCFLDGFFGYFQIPIDPKDQEKTTFTCPYGTFAYRCMPFGLWNAPDMFQRYMMAIFHDMIEKIMEVFMDDFSVFGNSF